MTLPKRPRGRPPVDDPWTKLGVSLRASDLARIRAAVPDGQPVSEWAREAILARL